MLYFLVVSKSKNCGGFGGGGFQPVKVVDLSQGIGESSRPVILSSSAMPRLLFALCPCHDSVLPEHNLSKYWQNPSAFLSGNQRREKVLLLLLA